MSPSFPSRMRSRMLFAIEGKALLFSMIILAAVAVILFFYEYHREKVRTLGSLQVAFSERLDSLDRCLYLARENVSIMEDWAQAFWAETARYTQPPGLADMLQYNSRGDYFEIPKSSIKKLNDTFGNVFGAGRLVGHSPQYVRELNLVAGLMPLLRATASDSEIFFQSYFFSASRISCIYPYLAVADLTGAGKGGANLEALVVNFFEPHRELYSRANRQGYWTGVYLDRGGHGPVVTYAMPVYSGDRYLGLLGTDISIAYLRRYVSRFNGLGGRLIMVGNRGNLLIDSAPGQGSAVAVEASLASRLPAPLRGSSDLIMAGKLPPAAPINGYYVFSKPLKSAPATFIHVLDEADLRSHLSLTWGTFCVLVPLVISLLLLTYFAIRRRQAEETLYTNRRRWQELIDNAAVGIYRVFEDGRFIFVNPRMARVFGYGSPQEMLAEVPNVIGLYNQPGDRQANVERIKRDGRMDGVEAQLRHRDGRPVRVLLSIRRVQDEREVCLEGFLVDVTERYRVEKALKESEERHRSLMDLFPDAVIVHSHLKIVYINNAGAKILGASSPEEIVGWSILDLIHPDYADIIKKRLKQLEDKQPLVPMEQRYIRLDGRAIDVEATGVSITYQGKPAVISVLRNIFDRKKVEIERNKLQLQLQQAQKLEAIGTLAGGIAHDFNNLLMGMQGNVSLSLLDVDASHRCYENLKNIESYIQKASELTRQILGFARGGKYHAGPLDINRVIDESVRMFSRTRKEIHVETRLAAVLRTVEADRNQMEQVLINLFLNAWQAMPGGGTIQVATENVCLEQGFVALHDTAPGDYVKISVSDNGEGMDSRTLQRIFEPFFTTKAMGRGTGLGLASVYGIIKNHGGIITVRSEKGSGSIFDIFLPASSLPPEEPTLVTSARRLQLAGRGVVLLVDDEDMILEVGIKLLESMGYRVLAAGGGREAVEIYKKHGRGIDLVILDMVMPDLNGAMTFERLKKLNPDVKVLLSSGYSLDEKAVDILNQGCNGFIQKPYDISQLAAKIHDILGNVDGQ